jgi:DNA replicative helicase MCM subunit Mcm2 (Cdc46/Mcm family)
VVITGPLRYVSQIAVEITEEDVAAILKFAGKAPHEDTEKKTTLPQPVRQTVDSLARLFAPNFIGQDDKKVALLLAMASACDQSASHRSNSNGSGGGSDNSSTCSNSTKENKRQRNPGRNGRISVMMIGPPGTSKTPLASEAAKVIPGSQIVSEKMTGRALVGIAERKKGAGHGYFFPPYTVPTLGPMLAAQNAICVICNFDRLSLSDQDHFLDAMDADKDVLSMRAGPVDMSSPAVLIATASPRCNGSRESTRWTNKTAKVGLDDLPFDRRVLDNFDLWLIFKNQSDPEELRVFANAILANDQGDIQSSLASSNYAFLLKYLTYAKRTIVSPRITDEARSILVETWVSLKAAAPYAITEGTLDTLMRVARAFARLCLREVVDAEVARHTADYVVAMYASFDLATFEVRPAEDPRDVAFRETMRVIIEEKKGEKVTVLDAVKKAWENNAQVREYIGNDWNQNSNRKLRQLFRRIKEEGGDSMEVVHLKPLTVRWKGEQSAMNRVNNDSSSGSSRSKNDSNNSAVAKGALDGTATAA